MLSTRLIFKHISSQYFSTSMSMQGPTIAVVLSGSGVYDGTEVHEAAAAMATITRGGAEVQCYAPDAKQLHVVDHTKGEPSEGESRNVLVESARIARGSVKPLCELTSSSADAVIFPGGFGAAKNLSDFATSSSMVVIPDVERIINDFHGAKKPIGLCCISPVLVAKVLGGKGVTLTLGKKDDGSGQWPFDGAIDAAKSYGANVVEKGVEEVVVDEQNKVVTSPAFMYAGKFHEIQDGVGRMVAAVLALIK